MSTTKRIEALNLTQNTAVGASKRNPIDWYLYPRHMVDDIWTYRATADANGHTFDSSAMGPPEFVCAVTTPVITLGSPDEIREDIREAVENHAHSLGITGSCPVPS